MVTHPLTYKRFIAFVPLLILVATVVMPFIAWANSAVSQGFATTSTDLTPGTLVGLQPGSTAMAVPIASAGHAQLLGIVADQPLVALSNGTDQVQVVVSGLTDAEVSDINGVIHAGDKVTASPITGVGMKATGAGSIVGIAQADLRDNSPTNETVTDKSGKTHTVQVGSIPLQVGVSYYAGPQGQSKMAAILPPFLLSAANSIAGQEVSALRALIGLVALLVGLWIVGHMLQTSIRAGITAVGRNPLAKKSIRRELLDVCLTAFGIFALTLLIVYLILRV